MSSLPQQLIRSLQNVQGFDEAAFKAVHESGAQITSVRLNPEKFKIQNSKFRIEEQVPWCSNGYYLTGRPSFTLDPLFHAGAYYVQDASSMFLEQALKQTVDLSKPIRILDLCAAPGGKSTLIQSLISKDSLLVSNEVIKTRVNILAENITKWGAVNVIVTNNDPKDFQRLQHYFDVIAVDAPCSGSGLFRKDPGAIEEWSENNVELCARRQQRILADVFDALKPGGILIYSTCSYSMQEDEAIANWLVDELKAETLKLDTDETSGIVETVSQDSAAYGYRFYPDKVKGEGFFIAAFKKQSGAEIYKEADNQKTKGKNGMAITAKEIETVKPFLPGTDDFLLFKQNEEVIAIPAALEHDLAWIQAALYIKKAGVRLGAVIRNELIPAHELAVSRILSPAISRIEVDSETALQYLRKSDVQIETDQRGWVLLTYQQLPIGWVKMMPGRLNNYYPKEWRILHK